MRSELITMRSNISSLEEAFLSISSILERVVRRSVEETSDLAGMSRELASLSNNTVLSLLDDVTPPARVTSWRKGLPCLSVLSYFCVILYLLDRTMLIVLMIVLE